VSWSQTVGALWLSEQLGGVSWRTCLADLVGGVSLWRRGIEPRLIGTLRCEDRQVPGGVSWSVTVGALWLALSDWRSNLAVSVGGPRWRSRLWRCGIEPGLIGTLRCGNRQGPVGVSWSLTVGALWLALSGWRRKPGGVSWRNNLADLVGGPCWRCRLWRCGIEPRLISTLRCEDRQVPGGVSCSVTVGALWLALSGWRPLTGAL